MHNETVWNGNNLLQIMDDLFPIMRSITGPGVRKSLEKLQAIAPLVVHEVKSGSDVLDWTVPEEWHFKRAWIEDGKGTIVLDSESSNLHVVNFSVAVDQIMSREELLPHLHSLPETPHSVPYRTTYYAEQWGFCLSHNELQQLGDGPFHVRIDAKRTPGVLNYGEICVPGESPSEILISTHICHPQLANDNLSGMVLAAALANYIGKNKPSLTWRFVFVPGTIGAISWLSQNQNTVSTIVGGLVLTGLGDSSSFNWKKTRAGNGWIDRLVQQVLEQAVPDYHATLPFSPYGYDERQYCSPGFNLPIGRLTRAVHGTFPEYHTSDDNMDFVSASKLEESLELLKGIADAIDIDMVYQNLSPYAEPQLGRRGLYSAFGANVDPGRFQMALLWMLNQSDGTHSLSDISTVSKIPILELHDAAIILVEHELLIAVRHASEPFNQEFQGVE